MYNILTPREEFLVSRRHWFHFLLTASSNLLVSNFFPILRKKEKGQQIMTTFAKRLESTLAAQGGYKNTMRRSVQTVILYEAHRCLKDRLPTLRPFQRKLAFWDLSCALLSTCELHTYP